MMVRETEPGGAHDEALIVLAGNPIQTGMQQPISSSAFDEPIASRFGYILRRASATMMVHLGRQLAELGFRPVDATILIQVKAHPGFSQSDIGRQLDIQRANMAPLIAALSKRGLLEKTRINGRSQGLSLTAEGERLCAQAEAIMDEHENYFAARLNGFDVDMQAVREALIRIASDRDDASD